MSKQCCEAAKPEPPVVNSGQKRIAVLGNPNCGKTTLFNALTGMNQYVGNWPGVTVEKKTGQLVLPNEVVELIDLPGIYALDSGEGQDSLDEQIARRYLLQNTPDLLINVVDASQLERNMYLTLQLLELGLPTMVVLNKADMLSEQGRQIDTNALSAELGCPVMLISARNQHGLDPLQHKITDVIAAPEAVTPQALPLEPAVQQAVGQLADEMPADSKVPASSLALRLLEDDPLVPVSDTVRQKAEQLANQILRDSGQDVDLLVADARYQHIRDLIQRVVSEQPTATESKTHNLDRIFLNKYLAIPLFLLVMYLMFIFTIHVGGAFIDFFDIAAGALFVDGPAIWLESMGAPSWLITFLTAGIGAGLQTVATFIPVVAALFIFQAYLEGSGYLSRAAFVVDRAMGKLGLPGKAFVPLIVGFGCSVPAVMATRTLETQRERILTSMMAPFMSCGARLPVYALFGVAFFAGNATNMVFTLYLAGIAVALFTGLMLRSTLLQGQSSVSIMELPDYQWPAARDVFLRTWQKLRSFVRDAGKVIVIAVTIIGTLNSVGIDGSFGNEDSENSVVSYAAKAVGPVFKPMGITEENWPASVGIVTGLFAKEAVVGTLSAVYVAGEEEEGGEFSLVGSMGEAVGTVGENLGGVVDAMLDPFGLSIMEITDVTEAAEEQEVDSVLFSKLRTYFGSSAAAYAYLLFILLYTPCLAVLGAMKRELGANWMWFSAIYGTVIGYMVATGYYQVATFAQHPSFSTLWLSGLAVIVIGLWRILKQRGAQLDQQAVAMQKVQQHAH